MIYITSSIRHCNQALKNQSLCPPQTMRTAIRGYVPGRGESVLHWTDCHGRLQRVLALFRDGFMKGFCRDSPGFKGFPRKFPRGFPQFPRGSQNEATWFDGRCFLFG